MTRKSLVNHACQVERIAWQCGCLLAQKPPEHPWHGLRRDLDEPLVLSQRADDELELG